MAMADTELFECKITRAGWAVLVDDWQRQVQLLETVERDGWAAATALLDEWGVEYSMVLRLAGEGS